MWLEKILAPNRGSLNRPVKKDAKAAWNLLCGNLNLVQPELKIWFEVHIILFLFFFENSIQLLLNENNLPKKNETNKNCREKNVSSCN